MSELEIRFTGKTGQVDGYMEMILGMFALSGVVRSYKTSKRQRPNGISQVYLTCDMLPPPLGHLGEIDMPDLDERPGCDLDTDSLEDFKQMIRAGDFVILDTETTGLHDGEICQIAIINQDGTPLLDSLVKTTQPIPAQATKIHGIFDDDVKDAPTWADWQPKVRDILRGQNVVIYNATYDRKMMHKSDERSGLPRCDYKLEALYWDAMELYAQHWGDYSEYHGSYTWQSLSKAAAQQNVTVENAHTALGDCLMTLGVVQAMALEN